MHDFRFNEKYLSLMPNPGTDQPRTATDPREPFLDNRLAGAVT